jgi:hypothetical protein
LVNGSPVLAFVPHYAALRLGILTGIIQPQSSHYTGGPAAAAIDGFSFDIVEHFGFILPK